MYERLFNILDAVGPTRVLLVGDFMLDYYLSGNADRISPEAPVLIINVTDRDQRPGGAGSVAVDLAALGARVSCFGIVGPDPHGLELRQALANLDGCDVSGLLTAPERPTTVKQRIIGLAQHRHRQQLMRIDEEHPGPLAPNLQDQLLTAIEAQLPHCGVVCLEDYNKGVLAGDFAARVIAAAQHAGIPVIVDPAAGADYSRYRGAWLVKPNRRELSLAAGLALNSPSEETWQAACQQLAQAHKLQNLVVTLDKQGAYLYRAPRTAMPDIPTQPLTAPPLGELAAYSRTEGVPSAGRAASDPDDPPSQFVPTRPRNVYDVTGAGDMVLATLGLLVGGQYDDCPAPNLVEMVQLANFAGGLEVERFGAVGIPREEILAELARERRSHSGKLRSREDLARELAWHRRQGHRIVFTNGCFDILHPGHVHLLTFARRQGDLLVVALNSDSSVRNLKGPTRPILNQHERAAIISALEAVDYVTLFDEPDPGQLIQTIAPDVLVKGSDWTGAVVGQDFVESRGGRVALMPLTEGLSTTNIIQQVLNQHAASTPAPETQP